MENLPQHGSIMTPKCCRECPRIQYVEIDGMMKSGCLFPLFSGGSMKIHPPGLALCFFHQYRPRTKTRTAHAGRCEDPVLR